MMKRNDEARSLLGGSTAAPPPSLADGSLLLRLLCTAVLILGTFGAGFAQADQDPMRIGIIGLDTSHSPAFTEIINGTGDRPGIDGFEVVAAYPRGSRSIPSSTRRIPEYTRQIEEMGVRIVGSIAELVDRVDAVLLETNDGRRHLEQALPVIRAGKPIFVDKPLEASLTQAFMLVEAARRHEVPIFSASALRYLDAARRLRASEERVLGADTFSPAVLEPHHPDLFWYGIHGVEILYTVMGPGCRTVRRVHTDSTDLVVGTWPDGRVGTFRGLRAGSHDYGGTAFTEEAVRSLGSFEGYDPLVRDITRFFETGVPPVDPAETLEIYGFMEAADESERLGGRPVSLEAIMTRARDRAERRIDTLLTE